jgi:DNA segregation ATPase FtsK/SpoIIIE-like protein
MQGHTLIAGVTGSGKSYCEHNLIQRLMSEGAEFMMLDPKRVELREYEGHPQVKAYADEMIDIQFALQDACDEMDNRYNQMIADRVKKYEGKDLYIVIDETMDIMVQRKKQCMPYLERLSSLGRAAKVWLIMCTQRSTHDVIPRTVVINLDNIVCLRQAKAVDSNQLIGQSGAERLPRFGKGYLKTPDISRPIVCSTDDIVTRLTGIEERETLL